MKKQTIHTRKNLFTILACLLFAMQTMAQSLPSKIEDGVILHCFNWKYTDIEAELNNIKAAGFVAVQTSPAQLNYTGECSWNTLYRPRDTFAGPNVLGTSTQLKSLCTAAHQKGIKIIVDVVANHTDGDLGWVADYWKDNSRYHNQGEINYGNRYSVTHGNMSGLHDIKTEDSNIQQRFKNYVKELKDLGVDGIRWDAAKHIGLPSEGDSFWSNVIDKTMFNYGEILDGTNGNDATLIPEYLSYMSLTDNGYCTHNILGNLKSGQVPSAAGGWCFTYSTNKLVYWGESHDNFCNNGDASYGVSQDVVDRAYAIAASHNATPALYLSRPNGGNTAGPGSQAGSKGSTHFKDKVVAEVNKFHNAMAGKADYYSASGNVCSSTRKGGGAIIVNANGGGNVNVPNGGGYATPGTYQDRISGASFTITATTISGNVGSTGVAVLWKDEQGGQGGSEGGGEVTPEPQPTLPDCATTQSGTYCYFENTSGWNSISVWAWSGTDDNVQNLYAAWPGSAEHLKKVGTNNGNDVYLWQYSGDAPENIIFNDGKADGALQTADLSFVNGGYYNASGFIASVTSDGGSSEGGGGSSEGGGSTDGLPSCATYVDNQPFCYFESSWTQAYVWAWMEGMEGSEYLGTEWPGIAINAAGTNNGNTVFQWISTNSQMPNYIIFNNGSGGVGNQTDNLAFTNGGYYDQNGQLIGTVTKGGGTVTSIDNVPTANFATVNIFSIDGQLIRRHVPASSATDGLSKGIYIVDGKKVIIK